jgi:hypothetical protein
MNFSQLRFYFELLFATVWFLPKFEFWQKSSSLQIEPEWVWNTTYQLLIRVYLKFNSKLRNLIAASSVANMIKFAVMSIALEKAFDRESWISVEIFRTVYQNYPKTLLWRKLEDKGKWQLNKFDQYKEFGASRLPTQYDFVCHIHWTFTTK